MTISQAYASPLARGFKRANSTAPAVNVKEDERHEQPETIVVFFAHQYAADIDDGRIRTGTREPIK